MAIPDFDENGNLPAGEHTATLDEVRSALVDAFPESRTRRAIYDYWVLHRSALGELVEQHRQWLAGSFTTDKTDPADADVVTLLDGPRFDDLPRHRQLLVRQLIAGHYTEDFWSCDAYPVLLYPDDHAGATYSRLAADRWRGYFGHDRDGNDRGFVVVEG